jgi:hypothetical protein
MKFTIRKRKHPNGRIYWIVMRGKHELLIGENHGECRYHNKDIAQAAADQINKELLEEELNTSEQD